MQTKHTPGPWTFSRNDGGCDANFVSTADEVICDLPDETDENLKEIFANGGLLAAAPDLLAALERLLAYNPDFMGEDEEDAAREQSATAIAKARGEVRTLCPTCEGNPDYHMDNGGFPCPTCGERGEVAP